MPPLGLSAGVRKARELGRRTLSLALASSGMVNPRAHYDARDCDGILVLQRGENPSTDYYLRPRLDQIRAPVRVMDLGADPAGCDLLGPSGAQALMVILCRYGAESWLSALRERPERLSQVVYFMDDDLPAVIRDRALPRAARGKAALHFGSQVEAISRMASEVWVSTPVLAERYAGVGARLLGPLPEADPPAPVMAPPRRVVYHGTDVHPRERLFVLEIARRLADTDPLIAVEITGGATLARAAAGLPNVTVVPQLAWPEFLRRQAGSGAAVSLAPLFSSPVNDARAPVKAFDAVRLGAAGLYADAPPYRDFVSDGQDGLLLAMDPELWTRAVLELMTDSRRRYGMALAAAERATELRRTGRAFPAPFRPEDGGG
jgi:hypothetical protein